MSLILKLQNNFNYENINKFITTLYIYIEGSCQSGSLQIISENNQILTSDSSLDSLLTVTSLYDKNNLIIRTRETVERTLGLLFLVLM